MDQRQESNKDESKPSEKESTNFHSKFERQKACLRPIKMAKDFQDQENEEERHKGDEGEEWMTPDGEEAIEIDIEDDDDEYNSRKPDDVYQ